MDSVASLVAQRVGSLLGTDPLVRSSDHGDYQANGALAEAKRRGVAPRDLATEVAAKLADDQLIDKVDVAGPGFINIEVAAAALWRQVAQRLGDDRLGVPQPLAGERIVIDYSQPNIAKEMHVGHLRSTVVGDALVRLAEFSGATVIRQNHVGDWGTQFGMMIAYLEERADGVHVADESGEAAVGRLSALYQAARREFDGDQAFARRARAKVVAFQRGDEQSLNVWRDMVDESKRYFTEVYDLLEVLLTEADVVGESFYNDRLDDVAKTIADRGVAQVSDGALCVFFEGVRGPDGNPVPLIIRKSDGGFGYAATDLAALSYRVNELAASRIWYVVDARQALHFRMVFDTARRAGILPDSVDAQHVPFGTVLGLDGKPFKTRSGETVKLIGLLTEAIEHARGVVAEKNPHLAPAALDERARQVGIGAVKYADLSVGRTKDYVFDLDRMVSLHGNTSVYLQYAHARVRSIMERVGSVPRTIDPSLPMEPAERRLALHLDGFGAAVNAATAGAEPHRLAVYLYELAQALTGFWDACPVRKAPSEEIRANRLALCDLTARTLSSGLGLLGIAAPFPL